MDSEEQHYLKLEAEYLMPSLVTETGRKWNNYINIMVINPKLDKSYHKFYRCIY